MPHILLLDFTWILAVYPQCTERGKCHCDSGDNASAATGEKTSEVDYINPMFFLCAWGAKKLPLHLIVMMSLQPAIPWQVALQHCPPPLHRPVSMLYPKQPNFRPAK